MSLRRKPKDMFDVTLAKRRYLDEFSKRSKWLETEDDSPSGIVNALYFVTSEKIPKKWQNFNHSGMYFNHREIGYRLTDQIYNLSRRSFVHYALPNQYWYTSKHNLTMHFRVAIEFRLCSVILRDLVFLIARYVI